MTTFDALPTAAPASLQQPPLPIACRLEQRGVIRLTGADARKFLQGQVTCNLDDLNEARQLAGAQCTPKGRMIFNFVAMQLGDEILLSLPRKMVGTAIPALKKYAVFFKTTIDDASDDFATFGLAGLENAPCFTADLSLALVPNDTEAPSFADNCSAGDDSHWSLLCLQAGFADIEPQTSDSFIPQMINWDKVGGISFRKGCYTGQEIVARAHYRGAVKRHMIRSAIPNGLAAPPVGADLFAEGEDKSLGTVAATATGPNGTELLLVLGDRNAEVSRVHFGDQQTVILTHHALDYPS